MEPGSGCGTVVFAVEGYREDSRVIALSVFRGFLSDSLRHFCF